MGREVMCLECGQDLGHDGDYKARLCADCTYYHQEEDE